MQYRGDLVIESVEEVAGQVTGLTTVRRGGHLVARGQLAGGLIIEAGGSAVVHGQVSRNVVNHGYLTLHGQVSGRVVGSPPLNAVGRDQIVGHDLPVPFRGSVWSTSTSTTMRI